jgi:hypothetical protein
LAAGSGAREISTVWETDVAAMTVALTGVAGVFPVRLLVGSADLSGALEA